MAKKLEELRHSKVFCTKAWGALSVSPSGTVYPCCIYEKALVDDDKKPFRIWDTGFKEIVNSNDMHELRERMLAGEQSQACNQCYESEKYGGQSVRTIANYEEEEVFEEYELDRSISVNSLDLKLSNKCNLKCRMCQPRDSSLIEAEFSKIIEKNNEFENFSNTITDDVDLEMSYDEIPAWDKSKHYQDEFFKSLKTIRKISIVGGEPLLLDSFYKTITDCVESGSAGNISFSLTTNLMCKPRKQMIENMDKFKKFLFNISLDAIGRELKYIRYPSSFDHLIKNFNRVYKNPETHRGDIRYQFTPTVQVYNVLYLADVFEAVENLMKKGFVLSKLPVHLMFLTFPSQLNIRVLPVIIRKIAIIKLETFLQSSKILKFNEKVSLGIRQTINVLKNETLDNDKVLFSEFIYYTNILDNERKQIFKDELPELAKLIEKTGIKASPPKMMYYRLREMGWKFAKSREFQKAIDCFKESLEAGVDTYIDHREMAWMFMEIENLDEAQVHYELAFDEKPLDQHVLRGLTYLYHRKRMRPEFDKLRKAAIKEIPDDNELRELIF